MVLRTSKQRDARNLYRGLKNKEAWNEQFPIAERAWVSETMAWIQNLTLLLVTKQLQAN